MAAKHILTDRSTCRKTYDGRDTVEMRQGYVSSAPDNEPDQKIRFRESRLTASQCFVPGKLSKGFTDSTLYP